MLTIKRKIRKNKRGEEMMIDFVAIAIFAVILLLFFFLFSFNKSINDKKVQEEFRNKDVNFMLESFLRAPALGKDLDPDKTVGEIIVEDSTNDNFDNTQKLFEEYFLRIDEMNGYKVNIIQIDIKGPHNGGRSMFKNDVAKRAVTNIIISTVALEVKLATNTLISPVSIIKEGRVNAYSAEAYLPGYNEKVYVKLSVSEVILPSELKEAQAKVDAKTNDK